MLEGKEESYTERTRESYYFWLLDDVFSLDMKSNENVQGNGAPLLSLWFLFSLWIRSSWGEAWQNQPLWWAVQCVLVSQVTVRSIENKTGYVDGVSFWASQELSAGRLQGAQGRVHKKLLTKESTFRVQCTLTNRAPRVFQFGNEMTSVPTDVWSLMI